MQHCSVLTPALAAPPAAYNIWFYSSENTGWTYAFGNHLIGQVAAETKCQSVGGHLVTWSSLDEQSEVEQYFIRQGYMLPKYHRGYWLGLRASQWPTFQWLDATAARTSYQHWGQLPDGSREPKQRLSTCGAGNYSLVEASAWGWSGENCNRALPYMCRLLKPGNITIPSNLTGNVFTLMTVTVSNSRAEALCNDIGGHLAAYVSQEEQAEMEYAFINSGYLLPVFHKVYWMGLVSNNDAWPAFSWIDRNVPNPQESSAYNHWGTYKFESYSSPEPNNGEFPENCAVANFSESYGFPSAWGWADVSCANAKAVVVCRRLRGWPQLPGWQC